MEATTTNETMEQAAVDALLSGVKQDEVDALLSGVKFESYWRDQIN